MYKLMLVEDEKILLNDLKENVDWRSMGVEVAGTAWNGQDALGKAEQLRPDIVIADIKMPVMDGLELAKRLKESDHRIQIIFLTGFDELHYAKTALEVEAIGYLLKPFNYNELRKVLEKARARLLTWKEAEYGRETQNEEQIRTLLHSPESRFYELEGMYIVMVAAIDNYRLLLKERGDSAAQSLVKGVQLLLRQALERSGHGYKLVPLEEGRYFIAVVPQHPFADLSITRWKAVNDTIQEKYGMTVSIGQCDRQIGVERFADGYNEAAAALNYRFYNGCAQMMISSAIKPRPAENLHELPEIEEALVDAICRNLRNEAMNLLENYFELLRTERVRQEVVIVGVYSLISRLYEYFIKLYKNADSALDEKGKILKTLECFDNIRDIYNYVRKLIESILDRFCTETDADHSRRIVSRIMQYLEEHYAQPVTVEDISQELYMAPSRLRGIFKTYTGDTIHEYLTNLRMKKSLHLIGNPVLRIKDIAVRVGYENISYFCILFAKFYGMPPNQYREKLFNREV